MKLLFFTDSRGQHKTTFSEKKIFTEKFSSNFDCDLMLCPYKWTTTLDFINLIETNKINLENYDKIILYTGVVEFSPRHLSNFKQCLSSKLGFIESLLGDYLDLDTLYQCKYRGEYTKSLISISAYENVVIPYLQKFNQKLIFINTNKIVPGWEGNYLSNNPYGRPKNINLVEEYSKKTIGKFDNLINLLEWDYEEIKRYTVDNMHLTYSGSEYIYKKIKKLLEC